MKRFGKKSLLANLAAPCCWLFFAFLTSFSAFAQDPEIDSIDDDQAFVQGLRARMLFDIADQFCDKRLTIKELSPVAQANLIVEKMRTQMARAVQTPPVDRVAAWQLVQQIGQSFNEANPQHPRAAIIDIQRALACLAEGRLIAAEARLGAMDEITKQRGMMQLREARKKLESLEHDLTRQLPSAPIKSTADQRITNEQLHSILANVRFQLAISSLEMTSFYPSEDQVNRIDVLTSVVGWLNETLGQVDPSNPLAHAARIRLAEAQRMMGKLNDSAQTLANINIDELNEDNLQAYWEQSLDLAVDADSPKTALPILVAAERSARNKPATQLAMLRIMLAMAKRGAPAEQSTWLSKSTALVSKLEVSHGTYWGRLAERTLIAAAGSNVNSDVSNPITPASQGMASIEVVARIGDVAFRESRWADARAAYEKGVSEAVQNKLWPTAFELQFKAAQAAEKLKDFDGAATGLLALVSKQPMHELAAGAHLRAIWNVAQLAANQTEQKNRFHDLLVEHLRDWPGRETSNQARLWLARLHLAAKEFSEAVENYLQISPTSPQAIDAASDLQLAVSNLILDGKKNGKTPINVADRISRLILARLPKSDDPNALLSEADIKLLLTLAPLVAEFQTATNEEMAALLEKGHQFPEAKNADWFPALNAATVAFLCTFEKKQGRAKELFEAIANHKQALQVLYDLLAKFSVRGGGPLLLNWQMATIEKLEALSAPDTEKIFWKSQRGQLLFDERQFEEAAALLGPLARSYPTRGDIQLLYARCLSELPDKKAVALEQWRRVALKVTPHSDDWFEAKYHVARLMLETNQKEKAAELLRYIQAVPPGWVNSKLKSEFEILLSQCKD